MSTFEKNLNFRNWTCCVCVIMITPLSLFKMVLLYSVCACYRLNIGLLHGHENIIVQSYIKVLM